MNIWMPPVGSVVYWIEPRCSIQIFFLHFQNKLRFVNLHMKFYTQSVSHEFDSFIEKTNLSFCISIELINISVITVSEPKFFFFSTGKSVSIDSRKTDYIMLLSLHIILISIDAPLTLSSHKFRWIFSRPILLLLLFDCTYLYVYVVHSTIL